MLPMKDPENIESWRKQYNRTLERYNMLVLYGPSKTGKTMWSRQAFGNREECFEVNCSSGAEPHMRGFNWFKHKWILLDEAKPKQILANKKFFHAQPVECTMGASATKMHAYDAYCHKTPMIICSNDWKKLERRENKADKEWLATNCCIRKVVEPLYVEVNVDPES